MKRRPDSNQILIDWTRPAPAASTHGGDASDRKDEDSGSPALETSPPPPVLRLPWDFHTVFPQPTDAAIDAGVLDETDREPENLKGLHDAYAAQCLAALRQLDAVQDAKRRGVDPATGKPPRTHASRERLRRYLDEELARLERSFAAMIGTYEDAFGADAADAFAKALRARHAGIEVAADPVSRDTVKPSRRASSAMPVPKPLAAAVQAGNFGEGDDGPVRPGPDEVRAITEQHAEKLTAMFDLLRQVDRSLTLPLTDKARLYAERDRVLSKVRAAVEAYAEDFGERAAKQLEAFARRQAAVCVGGAGYPAR